MFVQVVPETYHVEYILQMWTHQLTTHVYDERILTNGLSEIAFRNSSNKHFN